MLQRPGGRLNNIDNMERLQESDSCPMDSRPSQINLPPSLEGKRINALPPAAYYVADFISEEEEETILHKVAQHALFRQHLVI